jgi:glycogen debranching enzyme
VNRKSAEPSLAGRCTEESLELLRANLTPRGVLASAATSRAARRGYDRIFGRDAAICIIAMALCGDGELRRRAPASLYTLADHQAPNGQIPKYVDPERDSADFWYLGCIDATAWWLIAARLLSRELPEENLEERLAPRIAKALDWLACQEHQQLFLLQQNEASDWADIMPRSGFVLYTNALWY